MPPPPNNNPGQDKPKPPISNRSKNTPIVNISVNTSLDQVRNENATNYEQNTENRHVVINFSNPQSDNSPQIDANKIANRSVIINCGLFIFTAILAGISIWQGCLTRQSISIAERVFKADTTNANKVYTQSRKDATESDKREDERDKRAEKNLKLQDSSLNAQIASLKETQKQFKAQNEPYLQIKIDTILVRMDTQKVFYSISNATKTPVKVLKSKCFIYIDTINKKKDIDTIKFSIKNFYITESLPYNGSITGKIKLTNDWFRYLTVYKKAYVYIDGVVIYENMVDKNVREYKYVVKIVNTSTEFPYQEFIRSENIDLK
ncbi:hypothetical protein [Mucilaginibacter sp. OK098]|uniref:hypothetical protein n=1 Tax=Mucilaginibacter sp. OK098 TaxID=1855297 RepID=UPI000921719E|nr:hypothetical protein [Mucilaginibacter sp. OK098]SHM01366.1 hypothetical protein SAMN05216524_101521 [Mucilaginibacter sp. OK098]